METGNQLFRGGVAVSCQELLQPLFGKELIRPVDRLGDPIRKQQDAFPWLDVAMRRLVPGVLHQSDHRPAIRGGQLPHPASRREYVGWIMSADSVLHIAAARIENAVEHGDEHV